ncbi:hypothetical protein [Accumulibacter sp.]|uniref:hypothetical protein n=1 Tax=Accumulibacter sp. TaxID=2053492 RepID=UPI0025DCC475|nr:hypothetical protein [Accumulibacter sp.]MCP5228548.1 hypothetical protein [Accumulibacter sp.]
MRSLGPPTTTACGATPPTLRVALGRQELALTSIATIAAVFAPEWAQLYFITLLLGLKISNRWVTSPACEI